MKIRHSLIAALLSVSVLTPGFAQDSVMRGSDASAGASLVTASTIAWVAHAGSELTVKAVKATAQGIELTLEGASAAVETSAVITKEALQSAAVGVGTVVKVVADASGYALVASGRIIAYVPNEIARSLVYRSKR